MRILGIDYGTKRVGVAVSDETGRVALPVNVIANTNNLLTEIEKIAHEYEAKKIVIGESLDFSGQPNAVFFPTLDFKASLEKHGFDVHFEPEFLSSVQAGRFQGKTKKLDSSAAAIILQSYLDRQTKD